MMMVVNFNYVTSILKIRKSSTGMLIASQKKNILNRLKLLTRTQLSYSVLKEHQVKYFCNFFTPILQFNASYFEEKRRILLRILKNNHEHIIADYTNVLDQVMLYGCKCHNYDINKMILLSTIKFCIDIKKIELLF